MTKMWHFSSKFDQHLSLYYYVVKLKSRRGPEYWLCESCEIWFPKFTDNFDIISPKIHLKTVTILIPLKWHGENGTFTLCQWQRNVCIHYDVHFTSVLTCLLSDARTKSILGTTISKISDPKNTFPNIRKSITL